MAKGSRITLSDEERNALATWTQSGQSEQRLAQRARVILALAEGQTNQEVAAGLRTRAARVSKWRTRFARQGLDGLRDAFRQGRPRQDDAATERRIVAVLEERPPKGCATWTGTLVAQRLGDVSAAHVWHVLRRHHIQLQRRRSWCVSTDPEFAPKAADIVGVYLDPPENAMVLCVDEKPGIQALGRAQGWLRLPDGKALTGYTHEYKRHGTTTLFAALEVATGQVKTGHFGRRRRRESLAFMNEVVGAYPGKDIHVILDNLNTHRPKEDRWLLRHAHVHLHSTPTHASWLNQVEIWFSILSRRALKGASFTSPRQVREAIDRFVAAHNEDAAPFQWTKKNVSSKGLSSSYSNLNN